MQHHFDDGCVDHQQIWIFARRRNEVFGAHVFDTFHLTRRQLDQRTLAEVGRLVRCAFAGLDTTDTVADAIAMATICTCRRSTSIRKQKTISFAFNLDHFDQLKGKWMSNTYFVTELLGLFGCGSGLLCFWPDGSFSYGRVRMRCFMEPSLPDGILKSTALPLCSFSLASDRYRWPAGCSMVGG